MAKILQFKKEPDEIKFVRPANCFEINHNASLADIGCLVMEALSHDNEGNADSLREILFELHSLIYPNASYAQRSHA